MNKKITLVLFVCCSLFTQLKAQVWIQVGGKLASHAFALQVYNDKLMVGGNFFSVGGSTSYMLAEWNGSAYSDFNTSLIGGSDITDMGIYQGKLICVGDYYVNAFYGPAFVTEWTGTNFTGSEYYINSNIYHMYVDGDDFYISGYFTEFEGTTYNHLAKWNGSEYVALSEDFDYGPGGFIRYNGDLIIGGGPGALGVCKFDGVNFTQLGDNPPVGGRMAVYKDELYVINGSTEPARYISKWNGSEWSDVGGSITGGLNGARAILVVGDYLYVGGEFTGAGGVACSNVARWDGENWTNIGDGTFGQVVTDLEYYKGSLYATTLAYGGDNYLLKFTGEISPVEDVENAIAIDIFPNPVANILNVSIENLTGDNMICIRNIYGQIVHEETAISGNNTIDVQTFAPGYYQVTVRSGNREQTSAFVKR